MTFTRSDIFRLLLLFFCSHVLIIFNQAIGWDGYGLLNGQYNELIKDFKAYGLSEMIAILHYRMIHLTNHPILVYNISVFIISLFSMLVTWQIVKKIDFFSRTDAFFITALSTTIPYIYFNLIGFSAVYLYLFFLLGLYCLIKYKKEGSVFWRIAALALFFLSFYYHSHISYYLLALVLLWYFDRRSRIGALILKNLDFILLPVLFVLIQQISFAMYDGPKETGYNAFGLDSIIRLPKTLLISFQKSFLEIFVISGDVLTQMKFFVLVVLFIPLIYWLIRDILPSVAEEKKLNLFKGWSISKEVLIIIIGFLIFLLGAFPFSLVSKSPAFNENGSGFMHQCNLYLGGAMMIYGIIRLIINLKYQTLVFAVLFSCLIAASWRNVMLHNRQWVKEEAILAYMAESPEIRNNQTFLVDDLAPDLNSSYRLQLATLNGLMKRAYNGEQKRLAITRGEFYDFVRNARAKNDTLDFESPNEQFSMKDYQSENFDRNIIIENTGERLSDWKTLQLMLLSVTNKDQFTAQIKKFIRLKVIPCGDCPVILH
jgi:hypothetical protein